MDLFLNRWVHSNSSLVRKYFKFLQTLKLKGGLDVYATQSIKNEYLDYSESGGATV